MTIMQNNTEKMNENQYKWIHVLKNVLRRDLKAVIDSANLISAGRLFRVSGQGLQKHDSP